MNLAQQPQTSTGAPVINFAATSSNQSPRRRARVGKRPAHPDAELIEQCIEYGMQVSAGHIAYSIDPTDSEFAAYFDDLAQSRANRALQAVLDIEPKTIDGIRAKAGLVKTAINDWSGDLDELRQQFLISLADDVIRFQRHSWNLKQNYEPIVVPR